MVRYSPAREMVLADWASEVQRSTIQDLLAVTAQPDILSFALGLPAPELFPTEIYARAAMQVLASEPRALQYGPPWQPLKAHIVALMAQRNVICREEQVFLTTGAQQGMSLLARLLLNPRGTVLLEETVYSGIQQAIEPFQPTLITVPTDPETGMDVNAIASLLERQAPPAFIYAITDGHNPLGTCMSLEKRRRLVELARHYHVPIIEDDAYGLLWYDQVALPPMRALEDDWVFYLGSFSKILAPALRVGWIIAPEILLPQLSALKEASDIDTATFSQRTIAAYLATGHLSNHLTQLRQAYGIRRDNMLRALRSYFPGETKWHRPSSGMFVWVELPRQVDTTQVLKAAVERERVAFLPGHAFDVDGSCRSTHCMRLNFSHCRAERIEEGIARLARVLE
ncbi:MAG TPA: PLP-dependent aminotransferase family protein [Ktedonobacteraceae bacterium]|nr:PLP-dependent aminotransferase family protein [Ktedonobacteraceae bacterium]